MLHKPVFFYKVEVSKVRGLTYNISVLFHWPHRDRNPKTKKVVVALKCDLLLYWQLKAFSFQKSSTAGRSTFNRMSLNKKCNLRVCLSQRAMSLYKLERRGRQLVHTKVEQCQLQIDDLICLMDGASAFSYLPFCQCLSSNMQHCRATPLLCSQIALSFHSNHMKQIPLLFTHKIKWNWTALKRGNWTHFCKENV